MNFYEREVALMERRIKRIEEQPDPGRLKSNRLLYELMRQEAQTIDDAWKSGKRFSLSNLPGVMRAMGFYPCGARGTADRVGPELTTKCFDCIRSEGLPEACCDRAVMVVPLTTMGEVPMPSFVVADQCVCDQALGSYYAIAHSYGIPMFPISFPFEAGEEELLYVTNQIEEMIEFAEKTFPGVRYDEARLVELQELDRQSILCFREIFELLKLDPCPIDPREAWREILPVSYFLDSERALTWVKARRDELLERAEHHIGALPEEKLRCIWTVTGYNNDRAPFEYLASRGVALLFRPDDAGFRTYNIRYKTYGDESEYMRKLSPLEEVARFKMRSSWGGLAPRWLSDLKFIIRELKADCLINFVQSGCVQTIGLAGLATQTIERELGIPVLQLEGRSMLMESYSRERVLAQLGEFIDMVLLQERDRPVSD